MEFGKESDKYSLSILEAAIMAARIDILFSLSATDWALRQFSSTPHPP